MGAGSSPAQVRWSEHARAKAEQLSAAFLDVEDGLLANHASRTVNTGAADWLVAVGPWVIAYDHPFDGDTSTATIVTLWRP